MKNGVSFEELTYLSADGITTVHAYLWIPTDCEPIGIVQLAHGMCEYVSRYDSWARRFAAKGIIFCGNDHLGHGNTAATADDLGYTAKRGGANFIVEDLFALTKIVKDRFVGLPLFLYGHSMGGYGVLSALPAIDATAAVCINGFRKPIALMHRCARRYVGILADMAYPFLCLQNRFTFGKQGNTDALLAARQAQIPVLILNGKEDRLIPQKAKLMAEETQTGDILFRTVAGGHTGIWLSNDGRHVNESLMEMILRFFLSKQ